MLQRTAFTFYAPLEIFSQLILNASTICKDIQIGWHWSDLEPYLDIFFLKYVMIPEWSQDYFKTTALMEEK